MRSTGALDAALAAPRLTVVRLIRLYRGTFARLLASRCRFHPSCSAYAEEAVGRFGVARGLALSVWRIVRCSPLSAGGVDYPPGHRDSTAGPDGIAA